MWASIEKPGYYYTMQLEDYLQKFQLESSMVILNSDNMPCYITVSLYLIKDSIRSETYGDHSKSFFLKRILSSKFKCMLRRCYFHSVSNVPMKMHLSNMKSGKSSTYNNFGTEPSYDFSFTIISFFFFCFLTLCIIIPSTDIGISNLKEVRKIEE